MFLRSRFNVFTLFYNRPNALVYHSSISSHNSRRILFINPLIHPRCHSNARKKRSKNRTKLEEKILKVEKEVDMLERKMTRLSKQATTETDEPSFTEQDFTNIYEELSSPLFTHASKKKQLPPSDYVVDEGFNLPFPETQELKLFVDQPEFPSARQIKQSAENSVAPLMELLVKRKNLKLREYNKIIYACALKKSVREAEYAMEKMREAGIEPDINTYEQLINVYASVGDMEKTKSVFEMIETGKFMVYSCGGEENSRLKSPCIGMNSWTDANVDFFMNLDILLLNMHTEILHYYEDAFKLLDDMKDHGYDLDIYTYNSLFYASLHDPTLEPDDITFTNLFLVYGSHKEPKNHLNQLESKLRVEAGSSLLEEKSHVKEPNKSEENDMPSIKIDAVADNGDIDKVAISDSKYDLLTIGTNVFPLLKNPPATHKQTLVESEILFNYLLSLTDKSFQPEYSSIYKYSNHKIVNLSPRLFKSYLSILEKKGQFHEILEHYKNTMPRYNIQLNGWIFLTLLNACYRHKKIDVAWGIWQDWQTWWDGQENSCESKGLELRKLGRTREMEYETYKVMINVLARCGDIWGGIRLLQKLSMTQIPKFDHFQLLRQKCVEKDDDVALAKIMEFCYFDEDTKVKGLLTRKWKGVNVMPGRVGRRLLEAKLGFGMRNKREIDWKRLNRNKM
ncbi:4998_t:CDS:2 [Acaulospora colombiana]|uniref:4998_t:CDS:1 n=1 Tax=Acaulospora colombiana TaxID=27376 RepID=A0ACA9LCI7_9GLOM|nr:4998_t:CDS:2 [Acaulospora colombiana]